MKKFILAFFATFCIITCIKAQMIAGGEIYYELISPQKFKVSVHLYRRCEEIPLDAFAANVMSGSSMSDIALTRVSIKRINDTCGNPCQYPNNFSRAGFEKHSFEGVVDFNLLKYKNLLSQGCMVKFSIIYCCRSNASTHDGGDFYLDASVNACDTFIKKNHSPIFSMEPKFLVACKKTLEYSPGPLDTSDYDSLAFSLENIQKNYKDIITYKLGYSGQIPLTPYCPPNAGVTNCRPLPNAKPARGFYFDSNTMQIIFTPMECDEVAFVNLRISEYRRNPISKKMVLLGYTSREMLVQTRSLDDNNPPGMSEIPKGTLLNICLKKQQLNISTTDEPFFGKQTVPDITNIFWDNGYKHATLNIDRTKRERTASLVFDIDSTQDAPKTHYFTIAVNDKTCNLNMSTRTYKYRTYPLVSYEIDTTMDACNQWTYNIHGSDRSSPDSISGSVKIIDSSSKILYTGSERGSYAFNTNGTYIISYNVSAYPDQCVTSFTDTVIIKNTVPKAQFNVLKDTQVCASHIAKLQFSPSLIPQLKKIEWKKINSSNGIDTFAVGDSVFITEITDPGEISVLLTRTDGCTSYASRSYDILTKNNELFKDTGWTVCMFDQYTQVAQKYNLTDSVQYRWTINGKDTMNNTDSLGLKIASPVKLKLHATDKDYCQFSDSINIWVFDSFSFDLKRDKEEVCRDSSLKLYPDQLTSNPYFITWITNDTDTLKSGAFIYQRTYSQKTKVKLDIRNFDGCVMSDSTVIYPMITPRIEFTEPKNICSDDSILITPSIVPYLPNKIIMWYRDENLTLVKDSVYRFKGQVSASLRLKVGNGLCFGEDQILVQVNPKLTFTIVSNMNYHSSNFITLNTDKAFPTYQWFNNVFTRDNSFWAYELGTPGKHTVWCNVTDANGCIGGDTIDIFTDKFTGVQDIEKKTVRLYPNPGNRELFIEVKEDEAMSIYSTEGKCLFSQELKNGINTINVETFPTGLYVIRFNRSSVTWMKE